MSEKQFPASAKRLAKARKDGKVPKSRMVSIATGWGSLGLAIIPCLAWVRNGSLVQWSSYKLWTPQVAFSEAVWLGCAISVVLVGMVAVSGVLMGIAQTQMLFLPSQVLRGFEQCSPRVFLGRVRENALDATMGLLRCLCVALIVSPVFCDVITCIPSAFISASAPELQIIVSKVWSLHLKGTLTLAVIAAFGYLLARLRFYRQLRMCLQEMKDEYKEDEGDPHAKALRKQEHRALLFSEIDKRVKRSKVVVIRRMTA